jgi:uncharacterized protein (TIGR03663 family)
MKRWRMVGLILAAGVALALRCISLDDRPMHNDEAVNAVKFGQLWGQGGYKYDANEHHGPSLFYGTLAFERLALAPDFDHFSERRLRLVPVLFGVGLILLLPLVADGLGKNGVLWAAIFTAVSPAMVFYSRYYIHEMLLVFFCFLTIAAGWRYWRDRKLGWTLLAGAALGLMSATKETFVFNLVAGGVGLGLNQVWNRLLDASGVPVRAQPVNFKHMAAGFGLWLAVAVLLFSSFLTNASGVLDAFRTYSIWFGRAAGASSHNHGLGFYFHRLLFFRVDHGPVWSEVLLFALALIGGLAAFVRRGLGDANASFLRFLTLYTFALATIYSLISYKTPWCLLSFWHGMVLLAGVGAVVLLRAARFSVPRFIMGVLLVLGAAQLGGQAWEASTEFAADSRNPYVYAQTSEDILGLVERVQSLAQVEAGGHQMLIKVMAPEGDYWPLPWYLREFKKVGWWDHIPEDPLASVMIVSPSLQRRLGESPTHLMVGYYQLRPQVFLGLYVEKNLWRGWLEARTNAAGQSVAK